MGLIYIGEQFRNEVNQPFSLRRLEKGRSPVDVGPRKLSVEAGVSVNNLMLKIRHSDQLVMPHYLGESVRSFVEDCVALAKENGLPVRNRFLYLTLDSRPFKKGATQRNPGWHTDGMQGNEIAVKQKGCFHFLWTNKLPYKISTQGFDLSGLNVSKHHVFDSLALQIYDDSVQTTKAGHLYLVNCYQMHTAVPTDEDLEDRLFVRLSFSELPYTSHTMSLNPDIEYPFVPHSTSGAIPEGLDVWSVEPTVEKSHTRRSQG